MTALTVLANGVDITAYVDMSTLVGQNDLTQRIDTCSFGLVHAGLSSVDDKMDVVVQDQAGTHWFGGIVGGIERASVSKERLWQVDVQGWGALLDGALANKVYSKTTDVAIIADLLATYRPEITPGPMPAPTPVDHVAFPYKTVSNSLDTVCALTGHRYYVDPAKTLAYLDPRMLVPVLTLTDQGPNSSTTWSYEAWRMRSEGTQVQNRITAIGGSPLQPATTETFTGDGSTTVFVLAHRPHSISGITVGGAAVGVGHRGVDDYGGPNFILVLIDDAQQQLLFDSAPLTGSAVQVIYDYEQPIIARVESAASYARYGRWYDGKIPDGNMLSVQTALARASSVLAQYAFAPRTAYLRTRAPWTRSGQAVYVTNTPDGLINQQFLVQQSRWQPVGSGIVVQDLQLIG